MKNRKRGFEFLDHTADVILKVEADSLKELFQNAARGIFSLMTSLERVKEKENVLLKLTASSRENLLIDWLNELLFQSQSKKMLFSKFLIKKINSTYIEAEVLGEKIDRKRHKLKTEVKAATYYKLSIKDNKKTWQTKITLDV